MTTFRISDNGKLVEVKPIPTDGILSVPNVPMVPPFSLDSLEDLHKKMDAALGLPPMYMAHPYNFTAIGHEMQRMQALKPLQEMQNRLQNHLMDMARICIDPYMPKTVMRQVRFPRSKKKRIRKKWAKDKRNWKEFTVVFRIVDPQSFRRVTYPDGKERLEWVGGKRNAVLYSEER